MTLEIDGTGSERRRLVSPQPRDEPPRPDEPSGNPSTWTRPASLHRSLTRTASRRVEACVAEGRQLVGSEPLLTGTERAAAVVDKVEEPPPCFVLAILSEDLSQLTVHLGDRFSSLHRPSGERELMPRRFDECVRECRGAAHAVRTGSPPTSVARSRAGEEARPH